MSTTADNSHGVDNACGMPNARSPALLDGGAKEASFYKRGVVILSVGFLGVFGGFQAAQGLQTSLNATLGFINLAALYGTFTVLCLVAPTALTQLEATVGLRLVLFASAATYVAMAISNIYTKNWALPITMNVLVGVGAPLLWTCQNDYVARCAYHSTRCTEAGPQDAVSEGGQADGETALRSRLEANTALFNGVFFSIYQFAGAGGNVLASVLMLAFSGNEVMKDVLFLVLGGVSSCGALMFLTLPKVPPGGGQEEAPSLKATAALAMRDSRLQLMIPLMFSNGMTLSFIFGDYPTDITCPVAGSSIVGFVTATFFFVNSIASMVWGRLITKEYIRRRTAYVISTLFTLTYLGLKFFWNRPANYEKQDGSWNQVAGPEWSDYLVIFGLVALFACGDAFWESGPPATLTNFFAGSPDLVPALANYKLWQSLGLAVQFVLGSVLEDRPQVRTGIIFVLCVVSLLSLLCLDRFESIK